MLHGLLVKLKRPALTLSGMTEEMYMEPLPLFVISFGSLRIGMNKEHSSDTRIILNPILRGFHPDPSILRVDDDFYIANSTFQWFPGVRISHSRDLKHWRVLTHALTRVDQLDALPIWGPLGPMPYFRQG